MFLWGWVMFKLDFWSHLPGFVVMGVCTAVAVASFGMLLASDAQFIEALQVEPKLRCRPEEVSESKGSITSDGPPAIHDFRNTVGGDIELSS
jgi:hypothetical protein